VREDQTACSPVQNQCSHLEGQGRVLPIIVHFVILGALGILIKVAFLTVETQGLMRAYDVASYRLFQ
jgi:hypothetical protein